MKLAMIGFGQAGGKIVDKFVEYDRRTRSGVGTGSGVGKGSGVGGGTGVVQSAIAVNTARTDLTGLENIPESNRILIGQARVKGHGVGADNELGAEIAEENVEEIQGALDQVPVHEIDAFLVVAGMGGGTGSGGAPVLANHLKRIYTEPVFGLGILPSENEGGIYTLNAARSFKTFVDEVDNLLVFDNDAWRETGESVSGGYDRINEEIVRRFGVLFSAGEVGQGEAVAESVVDSSEIINTLACGGVSTVGYATEQVESENGGLLGRFTDSEADPTETTNRITSLVRKAALGRLTLPCEVRSTDRSLVVVSGPSDHLNRKGIERGRKWLENETASMEVRGGDYPIQGADRVGAVTLLAGVTDVPRIDALQRVAVEAQDNIEDIQKESEQNLESLVQDESEELEALF